MAVPENIEKLVSEIRNAIFGRDVREAIASSIELTADVADWARHVAQQIIDGAFEEGELATEIENKLIQLEQDYAPTLLSLKTEIEGARGNSTDLAERLNDFAVQIPQKADKDKFKMLSYSKYGNISLPLDFFHNINFNIYRDIDGKMKHDFDIDAYLQTGEWSDATYIYLSTSGTSGSNGLSEDNPTNQLERAFEVAESQPGTHFKFKILDKYFGRSNSIIRNSSKINISKNIAIVSDDESWIGNINQPGTWNKEGNVYRYNRSAVRVIYDEKYRTIAGLPMEYKKVDTLAECENTPGTFWTDGNANSATHVYVRTFDDRAPDERLLVSLGSNIEPTYDFELTEDVQFIMKNINMIHHKDDVVSFKISATGQTKGHVILHNSKIIESGHNGFMTNGIKYTWLFDAIATKTKRDGLNYHNGASGNHFILEFNCASFDCGINDTNQNNNATTAHEEAYILRINTKGWNTRGPVCIDVNGCYSILYDCSMFDSVRSEHANSKVAYHFADDAGLTNGKAIMINCEGGGENTDLLSTSGGFEKVQVRNLKGDLDRIISANVELIP